MSALVFGCVSQTQGQWHPGDSPEEDKHSLLSPSLLCHQQRCSLQFPFPTGWIWCSPKTQTPSSASPLPTLMKNMTKSSAPLWG